MNKSREEDDSGSLDERLRLADKVGHDVAREHTHDGRTCDFGEFAREYGGVARRMRVSLAMMSATSHGPAQVATPAYRSNWETIFGTKQEVGST